MDEKWSEYQKMVLWDLRRLSQENQRIDEKLDQIQIDLAALKVKAGVWGVAGGLFSIATMLILQFLIHK